MTALVAERFAAPADAHRYGEFRDAPRTTGLDGPVGEVAPGRLHLYGAWADPASHRLAITVALTRLPVSVSYVDGLRDGRGWAFRERTGADPVNGFTLLRQAFLATAADYTGPVTVPVLWDKRAHRIVTTDADVIGTALLRAAGVAPSPAVADRARWVGEHLLAFLGPALYRDSDAARVREALARLDTWFAGSAHLTGERLSDADVRLWVHLVRYDAGVNAHGTVGPRLDTYPHLWQWARALHALPAFRDTTDFGAFTAPFASVPDWTPA